MVNLQTQLDESEQLLGELKTQWAQHSERCRASGLTSPLIDERLNLLQRILQAEKAATLALQTARLSGARFDTPGFEALAAVAMRLDALIQEIEPGLGRGDTQEST